MKYKLIPKTGYGCAWYTDSIKGTTCKAYSKDGFETVVYIDNYIIVKN